jgi:hypothetical protein
MMETDKSPQRIYYKARDGLQINSLPLYFGWLEIEGDQMAGEHYKPKIERSTETYLIGYYRIEGDAANFSETFEKYGLTEITQEDFHILLSQWTHGGVYTPFQWGLAQIWQIAKST